MKFHKSHNTNPYAFGCYVLPIWNLQTYHGEGMTDNTVNYDGKTPQDYFYDFVVDIQLRGVFVLSIQ